MAESSTIILGLESSCDETSCALVAGGQRVLSNVVASQVELHRRFGGVVPEVASRAHIEAVNPILAEALATAGMKGEDVAAVAVTSQPGLIGSLLVAVMAGKTLAYVWGKPLIAVNHVHAHAYSAALEGDPIEYPAVALVVSGGHTALYRLESATDITTLGQTIDDAAGEAFDKVAAILGLGYPGGPAVDQAARTGDPKAVPLPVTLLKGRSLDFSFSGIKTAVLYHVNGVPNATLSPRAVAAKGPGYGKGAAGLSSREIADIAAGFQAAVSEVLAIKLRRAVKAHPARSVLLGGGVAANSAVRARMAQEAARLGCRLRLPPMKYCTDNAAMIAGLAYHQFLAGDLAGLDLEPTPTLRP
jgi:N6-L-threonylcarbamoyladenine synthase